MKIEQLISALDLKLENEVADLNRDIDGAIVGDLLSHIMGKSTEGQVWITIQTHKNVLAIASLNDLSCVIVSDGQKPDQGMMAAANDEELAVFTTDKSAFDISGELYNLLNS
jgi:serine kinase of HPr protein (carbohydrate metabolism regulator)